MLQVDMGDEYTYQFFINLETQKVVHVSPVDNWDLAMQSGSSQQTIFLNGGKGMAAYNTQKTKFSDVGYADTNQAKVAWNYDSPTGIADSAALFNAASLQTVYLVKLDANGTKIRKFQVVYADAFEYQIAVGDINSSIPAILTIIKNGNCNFTYFSFDLLTTVTNVEPDKNTWDIEITR